MMYKSKLFRSDIRLCVPILLFFNSPRKATKIFSTIKHYQNEYEYACVYCLPLLVRPLGGIDNSKRFFSFKKLLRAVFLRKNRIPVCRKPLKNQSGKHTCNVGLVS